MMLQPSPPRPGRRQSACVLILALLLSLPAAAGAGPGIHVAITPAYSVVNPGDQFTLDLTVTQAGSAFNGFDIYVGFDPSALTYVPTSFAAQRGSLMTDACANLFQDFRATPDSLKCTLVFLCQSISVVGPGQVYRLKFQASMTPQITPVRFLPGLQFYNIGLYVNPDSSKDALVQIGNPSAAGPAAGSEGPRILASPNPFRGRAVIRVNPRTAGTQRLDILDTQGRVVRHLQAGWFGSGPRNAEWDGRNDSGEAVSSGIYFVGLNASGERLWTRMVLIK